MVDKTRPSDEHVLRTDVSVDATAPIVDGSAIEALSTRRRRYVLLALMANSDKVMTLDDLAEELVEWERAADDAAPDDHRSTVRIQLHHVSLPALDEAGVVEYDPRSGMVRYEGNETCEAVLKLLAETSDG